MLSAVTVLAAALANCDPHEAPIVAMNNNPEGVGGVLPVGSGSQPGDGGDSVGTGGQGELGGLAESDGSTGGTGGLDAAADGGGEGGGEGGTAASGGEGGAHALPPHEFCIDGMHGELSLLFLVDTSLTMGQSLKSSIETRWDYVRAQLGRTLADLPDSTRVGMLFFPNVPANIPATEQCFIPEDPSFPRLQAAREDLLRRLDPVQPEGASPTEAAHSYAVDALRQRPSTEPRVIVLVTDGVPNRRPDCSEILGETEPYGPLLESVRAARADGIVTLAVGALEGDNIATMLGEVAKNGRGQGGCGGVAEPPCWLDLSSGAVLSTWLSAELVCE